MSLLAEDLLGSPWVNRPSLGLWPFFCPYDRRVSESSGVEGPAGLDTTIANVARVYDYMLGGKDNFAADRELGKQLIEAFPQSPSIARENRRFLGRAVRYCAQQGVGQFLDLGSGLPTMENVHEVARRVIPGAAVVYVDNDRVALTHANALLATSDGVAAILGDVRDPHQVLADAADSGVIDLSQPIVVLLVAVLHFITHDDDPWGIVKVFRDAMPAGSYLVLSHATHDALPEESARARNMYRGASSPMVTRSYDEIAAFFAGLELVEPGLVSTSQWLPQGPARTTRKADLYAGVGRKP
jgi:SAM-dependent methyltransferase